VASTEEITDAIHTAIGGFAPEGRGSFEQWVTGLGEIPRAMAQALAQAADGLDDKAVAPEFREALREHAQAYSGIGESADDVFGAHTAGHFWRED
jgi:hypothetical protein